MVPPAVLNCWRAVQLHGLATTTEVAVPVLCRHKDSATPQQRAGIAASFQAPGRRTCWVNTLNRHCRE